MVNLSELAKWANDEFEKGNRIKASKIYRTFCKHAKYEGGNPKMLYEIYTCKPPNSLVQR